MLLARSDSQQIKWPTLRWLDYAPPRTFMSGWDVVLLQANTNEWSEEKKLLFDI